MKMSDQIFANFESAFWQPSNDGLVKNHAFEKENILFLEYWDILGHFLGSHS